ncbi:UNVERIFIED_CONTAM: hypothetical protein FKN15_076597 [Acipenser sinensis]
MLQLHLHCDRLQSWRAFPPGRNAAMVGMQTWTGRDQLAELHEDDSSHLPDRGSE